MKFTVTLEVDVDLEAWTDEYGTAGAGGSLTQVLTDLNEPGWYFRHPKWQALASLQSVKSVVSPPDPQRVLAACGCPHQILRHEGHQAGCSQRSVAPRAQHGDAALGAAEPVGNLDDPAPPPAPQRPFDVDGVAAGREHPSHLAFPAPGAADAARNPMPTVTHNDRVYKLRSRKTEIPDLASMDGIAAAMWLLRNTYPTGTNHRRPAPNLSGLNMVVR